MGVWSNHQKMTEETDIDSIEDAIINIHETCLNPEIAAPLIRKNLAQNLVNEYRFRFFKKDGKAVCECQVNTSPRPKYLGRFKGLN